MRWTLPRIDETRLPISKPQPRKDWRGESCPDHTANVPDDPPDVIEAKFQAALASIRERNFRKRNGLSTSTFSEVEAE